MIVLTSTIYQEKQELSAGELKDAVQQLYAFCRQVSLYSSSEQHFQREISTLAHSILSQLTLMQQRRDAPLAIERFAKDSLCKLQSAKEVFDGSTGRYVEKKATFASDCDWLSARLESSPNNLQPLFPIPPTTNSPKPQQTLSARELKAHNPLWAYQREKIIGRMATAQMASGAVSLVEAGLDRVLDGIGCLAKWQYRSLCRKNPNLHKRCVMLADLGKAVGHYIMEEGKEILQHTSIPEFIEKAHASYICTKEHTLPDLLEEQYLIPREMSKAYVENSASLLPYLIPYAAIGKQAVRPFKAVTGSLLKREAIRFVTSETIGGASLRTLPKTAAALPLKSEVMPMLGRIDYSAGYREAVEAFLLPPKQFFGVLSKDLLVVQYHNNSPLGKSRSNKWSMPVMQANKLGTIEEVMNDLALLSNWGERSHVSVAKIPAGVPVTFLHGRAARQINAASGEFRPGCGVQYRFLDFDPAWIVETRVIPVRRVLQDVENKVNN